MNRGLFLMLVATLYTCGSVQSVVITVGDAKSAVNIALQHLGTARIGDVAFPRITLQTIKGFVGYRVLGRYFNCGLKPDGRYILPKSQALTVCAWFRTRNLLSNIKCYAPVYKAELGGHFVNLVADKAVGGGSRRFNYHLQVNIRTSTKEQLMDILLSRELE